MRYLVVIPARGGSKGIPHKNIYPLAGKCLLEWTIESITSVDFDGDIVVSTDDVAIAEVARKSNRIQVIDRPAEISGDKASTESALIHALEYMREKYHKEYDAIVTLQATSPLRQSQTIAKIFECYQTIGSEHDALLTLTEDRTDYWVQNDDGSFRRLFPNAPRRRQERKPLYAENSALYITNVDALIESNSVLGHRPYGYPIDPIEAVDINEMSDIYLAESLLEERKSK